MKKSISKKQQLCSVEGLVSVTCNQISGTIKKVLREKTGLIDTQNYIGASPGTFIVIKFSKPVFISYIHITFYFGDNRSYIYDMKIADFEKEEVFVTNRKAQKEDKIIVNRNSVRHISFGGINTIYAMWGFHLTDIKIYGNAFCHQSFETMEKDKSLLTDFQKLLDNPNNTSDLSLIFKNERIPVHKCILCIRSDYFQKLLTGNFMEKNLKEISLDEENIGFDLSKKSLQGLINFIYTGSINLKPKNLEEVLEFYRVADVFLLEGMKNVCGIFLKNYLSEDNVIEMLNNADDLCLHEILQFCLDYIKDNFEMVEKEDSFKNMKKKFLEKIKPNVKDK